MGTIRKWTKDKVLAEALKYKTRTAFMHGSAGAHKAAKSQGFYEEACKHMQTIQRTWTKEDIQKEALKYTTKTEFSNNSSAYMAAHTRGILDEVCTHMSSKMQPITNEEIYTAAKKYTSINEFLNKEFRLYHAAMRRGIKENVCRHMDGIKVTWTLDKASKEALKYRTKMEFKNACPSAYNYSSRNSILQEVCSHMDKVKMKKQAFTIPQGKTGIYILYNESGIVYVGKSSICIKNRVAAHNHDKKFDKVEIFEITSKADMNVAELYLISRYSPKYNKDSNDGSKLSLIINNLDSIIISKSIYNRKEVGDAI